MKRVITYGTFDLLHYGHIRLLERAKELGDYLVVGVTSDDFDKKRGKINVSQSLVERIQAVKATGLADEIIVEEYEGQKIDDIIKYGIDVFTLGSDWEGKFDYLKDYCEVVYLPRTEGVSSTDLRTETDKLNIGLLGNTKLVDKVANEINYVNGLEIKSVYNENNVFDYSFDAEKFTDYDKFLDSVDAIYIASHPSKHYLEIKRALEKKKHVLCETPIVLTLKELDELFELSKKNNCILMESNKTAYQTAYARLLLLLKCGIIGDVISIDSTCTSLKNIDTNDSKFVDEWNSLYSWGPGAMLPIFQVLGTKYKNKQITTLFLDEKTKFDKFTKIDFTYDNSVATMKVGKGVKSEGELIISGTKGYIYVPAPWWKTDYFEVRYEDSNDNKKYFYELEGEGFRNELVVFLKTIKNKRVTNYISKDVTRAICSVIEDFNNNVDLFKLN